LLGGNFPETPDVFEKAKKYLLDSTRGVLVAETSQQITKPWGQTNQSDFFNKIILIENDLAPLELLSVCKKTESALGRTPSPERYGPRLIDVDILALGELRFISEILTIPHPLIAQREFVTQLLREIPRQFLPSVLQVYV
jgi:2-amino-4-hydroxy-6-hydroxymethyldihydropteridine diphosphokinase